MALRSNFRRRNFRTKRRRTFRFRSRKMRFPRGRKYMSNYGIKATSVF